MNTTFISLILILGSGVLITKECIDYPEARRVDQVDVYHKVEVKDPYRWMEQTDSEEVKSWIDAQEKLLTGFTAGEIQTTIASRIEALRNTGDRFSAPTKAGSYYYYQVTKKEVRHPMIERKQGLNGKPELVLDFNQVLEDNRTFGGYSISADGNYMVFKESEGQSIWGNLKIYDLKRESFLDYNCEGVRSPGVVWNEENDGFYYVSYGETEALSSNNSTIDTKVQFHRIGNKNDKVIYTNPDHPNWSYGIAMNREKDHLVISEFQGSNSANTIQIKSISGGETKPLFPQNAFNYTFLGNYGSDYYFYTNEHAPRGKIIKLNSSNLKLTEIVPESEETIQGGSSAGGNAMALIASRIVLLYRLGPEANVKIFDLNGKLEKKIDLETGWIGSGLVGRNHDPELFYSLTTFHQPSVIYRLDLESGKNEPFFAGSTLVNPDDYISKYVYYQSKDGTSIPLYVTHKKGMKLDGNNPVYMYAYGFAGWVAVPWYQPHLLTWLDMGGVYVLPGIRGGGEYGEEWEQAGVRLNRQNAIDDYIAAAEYLIVHGYTSPELMVANGWSASGSLAAAAVMQRPDLFGAAIIGIPSLDLLRYQEFTPFKGWSGGYGSPENEDEFKVLYSYSPYHNIKANTCYPPILVTVGEKDQTTPPQHAYKFIARMQYNQSCDQPVLMKIVRGGGHGFGTTPEQSKEVLSQELTYLVKVLGLDQWKTKL